MDLDHAGLHHVDQAGEVVDHDHRLLLADLDAADAVVQALPGMLGEEAFGAGAGRTAQQAERPAGHMRQNPVGDLGIELGEPLLGDAGSGHKMRSGWVSRTCASARRARRLGDCRRALEHDLVGRLVLAQSLERRGPQQPRPGSSRETRSRRPAAARPSARPSRRRPAADWRSAVSWPRSPRAHRAASGPERRTSRSRPVPHR